MINQNIEQARRSAARNESNSTNDLSGFGDHLRLPKLDSNALTALAQKPHSVSISLSRYFRNLKSVIAVLMLVLTVNAHSQTKEGPLRWSGVWEQEFYADGTWLMWWQMIDSKGNKSWKLSDCSYEPVGTLI